MILVFVLTTSNTQAQNGFYESAWVDKQNEMTSLTIVKENDSFWLYGNFVKEEISKGNNPYVTIEKKEFPIEMDITDGSLIFKGIKYIPEFKSKKRQFTGSWLSLNKKTIFDIKLEKGGILWDIIKDGGEPIRFYPKLTETGFTFTIGDEQLYYTIENGTMTDSKGNKYIISRRYKKLANKNFTWLSIGG